LSKNWIAWKIQRVYPVLKARWVEIHLILFNIPRSLGQFDFAACFSHKSKLYQKS